MNPVKKDELLSELIHTEYEVDIPEVANSTINLQKREKAQQIMAIYEKTFEELGQEAEVRINRLIEQAHQEYHDVDWRKIAFYIKYKAAVNGLEEQADKAFNEIYESLKEDLMTNRLPIDLAASYKNKYESTKRIRKQEIYYKLRNSFM